MSAPRTLFAGFAASMAIVATALPGHAAAQGKIRLAVMNLENNTTFTNWGDNLGSAAADELMTQLVKTGAFTVIERKQLESVLAEQHLGMSGAVDPATAARIGKILGVQAIVLGSITKFTIETKSGGIGRLSASYTEAESNLDLRLVNTNTAEVLAVAEGKGKKHFGGAAYKDVNLQSTFNQGVAQEALRPAVENAVQAILEQKGDLAAVASTAATGEIVGARGGNVYIDRGENFGIKVGQTFEVRRVVDTVKDASGNVLDTVTDKVGVIKVTRVLGQSSICAIVEGEAKQGDKVQLTPPAGK